ncbi:MAG: hypothetical protein KDK39_18865 [Leptospiraceae bacterium]|nr:hypothetical protein [Leptospiraceae bacterium]
MKAILARLNRWSRWHYLALALAFYLVAYGIEWARYDWNPSIVFHFGHYYVEQNPNWTPAGAIRLLGNEQHGGNGYDGQIFYYFARSLIEPGQWPRGFSMAYRAPRIALPLLTAPFALLGNQALVTGFYLVQMGLFLASLVCLLDLLPAERRYLGLLYIASPFALRANLLMVTDSTALALVLIGLHFWSKARPGPARLGGAWLAFSLAILAKESALFLLFPLGLWALVRLDLVKSFILVASLLPMLVWQIYLREAQGMVPANILGVFIAPLQGITGLGLEALQIVTRSASPLALLLGLARLAARLLLVLILLGSLILILGTRGPDAAWHWRLAAFFAALSIVFADHFYFWGVFDNIGRMFTMLLAALILWQAEREQPISPLFGMLGLACLFLSSLLFLRMAFLTPVMPYDTWTNPVHEQSSGTRLRLDPLKPGLNPAL